MKELNRLPPDDGMNTINTSHTINTSKTINTINYVHPQVQQHNTSFGTQQAPLFHERPPPKYKKMNARAPNTKTETHTASPRTYSDKEDKKVLLLKRSLLLTGV